MRAIAWHRAGRGVEGRERTADAGIVFQGVETGIDREGPAHVLEVVAELHALVRKRAGIAERSSLIDAVHAQTHAAAFAADKPAVRKIVAPPGVAAVEARQAAAGGRIAPEADGPAWNQIGHRGRLGIGRSPAQAERRRQYQCET
jgi:hypothetical protein